VSRIACTNCSLAYPDTGTPYRCPRCGGIFDFSEWPAYASPKIQPGLPGIWRFQEALGLPPEVKPVSLGEGNTPLVWGNVEGQPIAFKLETLNPSGSYKDRGSAVLMSFLQNRGVTSAVEDSSGNAGASFAAYAARAGVHARVFIPDSAAGPKRYQIQAYGAEIVRILGPRSNAAEAVLRAADGGAVYASHAYLPFGLTGYATIAYELLEQLGAPPGAVLVPVGQGNLLLAIGRGFEVMKAAGVISSLPYLVGVQARACAPLWAAFHYGTAGMGWVTEGDTLAEGVRVKHPLRGDALMTMVAASKGTIVAVDEDSILPGRDALARQGLYVEPTSAILWDALTQITGMVPQPIVCVLTGSGLKTNYA
jgi:threonine synthase